MWNGDMIRRPSRLPRVLKWVGLAGCVLLFFGNWYFLIPLWVPLFILTLPTGCAWYFYRRPPFGHCQRCEYDLTGNVSGVCPECGAKA